MELKDVTQKIEEHRDLMNHLISEKEALTDPKLVALSQELDGLLNEYDELLD